MLRAKTLLIFALFFKWNGFVNSQALNGECSTATPLTLDFFDTLDNDAAATGFSDTACNIVAGSSSLWYSYEALDDEILTARVTDQTFSASLAVFSGACTNLICISSDGPFGSTELDVSWAAITGTTYYIAVSGMNVDDGNSVGLEVQSLDVLANDECEDALDVSSLLPYDSTDSIFSAYPSTFSDPDCGVQRGTRQAFYSYTPTEDSVMLARVSDQDFSASLSVFGDTCAEPRCISFSEEASQEEDRLAAWIPRAGKTYYVVVSGADFDEAGDFQLEIIPIQRPANDVCSGATDIAMLPFSITNDNVGAVPGFSNAKCMVQEEEFGVWYKYLPERDEIISVAVQNQDFPVALSLYGGDCEALSCRIGEEESEENSPGFIAQVSAGVAVYFLVSGARLGEFELTVSARDRPVNDVCTSATAVPALPFQASGNSVGAVPYFYDSSCDLDRTTRGLWFSYSPVESSLVRGTVEFQDFLARLSVFLGGTCGDISCFGSDGVETDVPLSLLWPVYVGTTYYLLVSGDAFGDVGNFELNLEAVARPANDQCNTATIVSQDLPWDVFEENTGALPQPTGVGCGVDDDARALYYAFTPPETAMYKATLSKYDFSAVLSVFSGDCESVKCMNKDGPCFQNSEFCPVEISWTGIEGTTYYLAVSGQNGFDPNGFFGLSVERSGPVPPGAFSPTDAPMPRDVSSSDNRLSTGALAGIAVGGAAVLIMLVFCFLYHCKDQGVRAGPKSVTVSLGPHEEPPEPSLSVPDQPMQPNLTLEVNVPQDAPPAWDLPTFKEQTRSVAHGPCQPFRSPDSSKTASASGSSMLMVEALPIQDP